MKLASFFVFGALVVFPANAQVGTIATPVVGYAFDPSLHSIRPIRGVPGASMLGDPFGGGPALRNALVAPSQTFALGETEDGTTIVSWKNQTLSSLPLAGAIAAPDRMIFSPAGTSAILLSNQSSPRLQILTGLPTDPVIEEVSLAGFDAPPAGAAVSDDGKLVLLSFNSGQAWLLNSSRGSVMLPLSAPGTLFSFRRNSHQATALTAAGDLYFLENVEDGAALRMVLTGEEQLAGAIDLRLSDDGAHAYAAMARGAADIDLAASAFRSVTCGCTVEGLQPLKPGLFRLTGVSNRPIQIFDASESAPRIWFVPADRSRQEFVGENQ